jgi:putative endonuclease
MCWQVYIIKTRCGKLYTGISTDVGRRFKEHLQMYESKQGKGAKFFRGHQPVKVVFQQSFECRSSASKRESEIKKMNSSQKSALVVGFKG